MQQLLKRHGTYTILLLNLALVGILGGAAIQGAHLIFTNIVPQTYFLEFSDKPLTVNSVCLNHENHTVLSVSVHREIFKYLPDNISQRRAVEGHGITELRRGTVEKGSRDFSATYQWEEDNTAEVSMTFNQVLLPGQYSLDKTVWPVIPYRLNVEPYRLQSNTFEVGELEKCI